MKQRYVYSIMYAFPGLVLAAFVSFFVTGAIVGMFWIFIFGDSDWPFWTWWIVTGIGVIVFIVAMAFIIRLGFSAGKKREIENTAVERKHIILSIIIFTVLIFAMFFFQQGYVFTEPSGVTCRNICIKKGYDGTSTGLSPEFDGKTICSCWNDEAKEWEEVETIDYK